MTVERSKKAPAPKSPQARAKKAAPKAVSAGAAKATKTTTPKTATTVAAKKPSSAKPASGTPALLSGENPQIAKADGDAPVQAYIAAVPGWKKDVCVKVDALIQRTVPNVKKAVKWNSPFYGIEGQGWFVNFHCFTKYVKVAFFRGSALRPLPPGESKQRDVRYVDLREQDPLDEKVFVDWVRQAAKLPGWMA